MLSRGAYHFMREFIPKKQQEKEVISIRIASDLLADLDNVALRYEISRNELIVQCLEYALADIPAAPETDTDGNNTGRDIPEEPQPPEAEKTDPAEASGGTGARRRIPPPSSPTTLQKVVAKQKDAPLLPWKYPKAAPDTAVTQKKQKKRG